MNEPVSDDGLQKTINERLSRAGGGATRDLRASVLNGVVTILGGLRFETQRRTFLKAITGIAGVRNIVDKMTLAPARKV